ncbi:GNAT family N-acetyltransferase [Marinithermofilum abyssi]|nr:GNAT family N-acetyltransferase [Marinithermofilum abyssi]
MAMEIQVLTPSQLNRLKPMLLRFAKTYGDKRITHQALRWLRDLSADEFPEGTLISVAIIQKRLAGIIAFGRYGLDEALIVVHPSHRKSNVGETLLYHALEELDKVYTRVACDNIPSLRLCFSTGLVAFRMFTGPTGKPTLWLGGGNWNRHDVTEDPARGSRR